VLCAEAAAEPRDGAVTATLAVPKGTSYGYDSEKGQPWRMIVADKGRRGQKDYGKFKQPSTLGAPTDPAIVVFEDGEEHPCAEVTLDDLPDMERAQAVKRPRVGPAKLFEGKHSVSGNDVYVQERSDGANGKMFSVWERSDQKVQQVGCVKILADVQLPAYSREYAQTICINMAKAYMNGEVTAQNLNQYKFDLMRKDGVDTSRIRGQGKPAASLSKKPAAPPLKKTKKTPADDDDSDDDEESEVEPAAPISKKPAAPPPKKYGPGVKPAAPPLKKGVPPSNKMQKRPAGPAPARSKNRDDKHEDDEPEQAEARRRRLAATPFSPLREPPGPFAQGLVWR